MTFAKTFLAVFLAVFLAIIAAAGLAWYLSGVVISSYTKAYMKAETNALFKSAMDHELSNWTENYIKGDPDGQIYHKRVDAIKKAQERGDASPPRFSDSYAATLKEAITLADGSRTLPAGTGLEFVAFRQNGSVQVRYSGMEIVIPASAVEVK